MQFTSTKSKLYTKRGRVSNCAYLHTNHCSNALFLHVLLAKNYVDKSSLTLHCENFCCHFENGLILHNIAGVTRDLYSIERKVNLSDGQIGLSASEDTQTQDAFTLPQSQQLHRSSTHSHVSRGENNYCTP